MPTFPTYQGPPLPNQLNPFNPFHWWMLLTWVFFYPSRIKHYLYRVDPKLYAEQGVIGLSAALRQPAYRALLITGFLTTASVPFIIWGTIALCGIVVDWRGIAGGVVAGVLVGIAVDIAFSLTIGVTGGVSFGVAIGVALGIAFGITRGATLHVAFGVALGMDEGMTIGVIGSMFVGIAFGVAFGVTLGIAGGVAFGVTSSAMVGVILGIAGGAVLGMTFGIAFGAVVGLVFGIAFGVGILIGALQLFSSLAELLVEQQSTPFLSELGVLPPTSEMMWRYQQRLAFEPEHALHILHPLWQNSFRSPGAFRCLNQLLNDNIDPLTLVYAWLRDPQVDQRVFIPLSSRQLRRIPTLRRILLGDLSNTFVDRSGGTSETSERITWQFIRRFSNSVANHPLIPLMRLLLELDRLGDESEDIETRLRISLQKVKELDSILAFPNGKEVTVTFALMSQAFDCHSVEAIATLQPILAENIFKIDNPLQFEVLEVISALADIGKKMVDYTQASNSNVQGALLNRVQGLLNELATQIEKINLPEQHLLNAIVEHWRKIVAAEAGRIGERALREFGAEPGRKLTGSDERQSSLWQRPALPYANPYITGRPVSPPIFAGRNDILHQIAERWRTSHTPDSIILYGHRRMGKTSIVRNLGYHTPAGSLLVYLDLIGITATSEQSGDLLLDLAEKIHAAAHLPSLPQPQFTDYQQAKSADLHFQRLLRTVIASLPDDAFLLLAFDEFEALERAVTRGLLSSDVYGYLRMLSQQPRIMLILAGLHTLDEMSRDYQQAFFTSFHNVRVSYLPFHEAERLIARPTLDFTLNYDRDVIEAIYRQTYGQPLLIQSICSALVNQLNHELFDLELPREARILPADLDAILTDDFLHKESRYFEGIWRDQIADFPDQQRLLHILARHAAPLALAQLVTLSGLPVEAVNQALQALAKRDVIIAEGGEWRLLMPLFQRWLQLHEA